MSIPGQADVNQAAQDHETHLTDPQNCEQISGYCVKSPNIERLCHIMKANSTQIIRNFKHVQLYLLAGRLYSLKHYQQNY